MSDPEMLQHLAERAVPPWSRAGRSKKVAQSGASWVYFEHPYTSVNGVGNRDINIRDLLSSIQPIVAHLCSLPTRSDHT
jgi:hypothetical protein